MQSRGAILPLLERPIGIILMLCLFLIIYAGVKRIFQFYSPNRVTMTSEIMQEIEGGGKKEEQ
jgi:putative tricarboxylic transport membrane protein